MANARLKKRKKKVRLTLAGKFVVGISVLAIVASVLTVTGLLLLNTQILSGGEKFSPIKTPGHIQDKVSTFLVLGISDDESERESTALTDTILLAQVDFEKEKVSILQIPRDTYVGGEVTPTGKINAIYNRSDKWDYHGLEGLTQKIHEMFQIEIDHYVTMKMDGFADIVDSIGGVPMDVPVDMELNGTVVKAGPQVLNGEQAIAVVRTRNVYSNQDLGRIETQRAFLSAFANQCLSLGPSQMVSLIPKCFESVNTDLTALEAVDYYKEVKDFDLSNVSIMTVPGVSTRHGDQDVYSVYPNHTAKMLNDYFRPYSDPVDASQLQILALEEEPPLEDSDDGSNIGTLNQY
ncbi:MAG: LCP family protein [Massiliimalia sp.]|jgi:LCP family protein required for cell wall assembly